ncbi:MAG: PAS domain S-box protein [Carboxylicivirga sp.]|jgi:PAS domain S-box-containing protein|nr:PAS domain S-box protein [Carboxylicivirga sp.]
MKNIRFSTQLIIGFGLIIILSISANVVSLLELKKIKRDTDLIIAHPFTVSNAVKDININITAIHRTMKDLALSETEQEVEAAKQLVNHHDSLIHIAFNTVIDRYLGEKEIVMDAYKAYNLWEIIRLEVIEHKRQGEDDTAIAITRGKGDEHVKLLIQKTSVLIEFALNKANDFHSRVNRQSNKAIKNIIILMFILFAGSMLVSIVISRSILKPIRLFIAEIGTLFERREISRPEQLIMNEKSLFQYSILELKSAHKKILQQNKDLSDFNEKLGIEVKKKTQELQAQNEEYQTINNELIKARAEIEEREERIRQIGDNIPEGMIFELLVKADGSRHFTYVSKKIEELHECTAEEVMADSSRFFNRVLTEDIPSLQEATEKSMLTMDVYDHTVRIKRRSGEIRWNRMISRPIKLSNGDILFHGIDFDITDRRNAIVALKESETREKELADIVRYAPIAIAYGYPDGRIDKCNAAFSELTGYTLDELKTVDWNSVLTPEKWNKIEEQKLNELVRTKKNITYEKEYIRKDGVIVPIELHVYAKFDEYGDLMHYVGFVSDITERKAIENQINEYTNKLREANNTKDKFLSIISHDLRGPFGSMLGLSDILVEDYNKYSEKKRLEKLQILNRSIGKAVLLLNDLLLWSRSQTGKIELNFENISIKKLIGDVVEVQQPILDKKQISITTSLAENAEIFADKNTINTVVRNLLSNAIKFSFPDGTISIEAKETTGDNNKKYIKISVIDNGIGISNENMDKLFNNYMVSTIGTNNEQGTGLGLALCSDFVEKNGGQIGVESEQNKKTIFWFTVPVANSSIKSPYNNKQDHEITLLIVDDKELDYQLLKSLIQKKLLAQCTILYAKNGIEAINACRKNQYIDLIFMDLNMPTMDGFNATEQIKKEHPHIKLIVNTSETSEDIKRRAFSAGCDDFILKPIHAEILSQKIDKYLSSKQLKNQSN